MTQDKALVEEVAEAMLANANDGDSLATAHRATAEIYRQDARIAIAIALKAVLETIDPFPSCQCHGQPYIKEAIRALMKENTDGQQ